LQWCLYQSSVRYATRHCDLDRFPIHTNMLSSWCWQFELWSPISNFSFFLKLVERVDARRFVVHADHNKLFPVKQSACRQQHSTESDVVSAMNDTILSINTQHSTLSVVSRSVIYPYCSRHRHLFAELYSATTTADIIATHLLRCILDIGCLSIATSEHWKRQN